MRKLHKLTEREERERKSLMLIMRGSGLTLQEIGDRFDLSRERVRQIIGNTGRRVVTDYKRDVILANLTTPIQTLSEQTGISESVIRHYSKGFRRPLVESDGCVHVGEAGEVWVNDHLNSLGFNSRLTRHRHNHYDLIVNGYKVDVKTTKTPWSPPTILERAVSPAWRFNIRCGKGRPPIDFYICVINHETKQDVFVIPYGAISIPRQHLTFCWPTTRPEIGKFQKYYERYDLLEK